MSFVKGNRFWELRSKHGKDLLFSSPILFWEACCEYFEWCSDNPLQAQEVSGGKLIEVTKLRAFTIQGLCLYLNANTKYFNQLEGKVKEKDDEISRDYANVLSSVREIIYNQKYSGAAAGLLSHVIIARDLGLSEKIDSKNTHTMQIVDPGDD